ncbi:hypothetical protein FOL47_000966 [Perkinsus chesapeaki]|uniref:Uncharacterized protein n=1 Tax=Perkinsus chesapeaki TaxID=330153 RepID=A0A7J6KVS9_PERCH|nr:hypothetical protein FOL47_000966 [Perkinsus chesapeaki]
MPKRRSKHPRSQQGKIRRSVKERTRRALRGHSLREGDRAECGVMVEEMQSGESSEVDLKSIALYKEAISMAENRYLERCSQITDGTARADAVTWGPLCDERDPAVIPSYGGDEMRRLRDELGTIGNNLKNDPQLSALEEWCRLTRDEQGKRPEIWSTIRPVIKDYAARLREVWVSRLHVLKEAPIDVTPMRVGLLKALAEATQDLSDKDDVELLDQILNEGGVHIGIDEPLNETGKWPRNRKADLANACSDDELGLSEFALHSWKNYQSAVGLEDKVKEYLQKEVKLGLSLQEKPARRSLLKKNVNNSNK